MLYEVQDVESALLLRRAVVVVEEVGVTFGRKISALVDGTTS